MKRLYYLFLIVLCIIITFKTAYTQVETNVYIKGDAFLKEKLIGFHSKSSKKFELPFFDATKMLEEDESNKGKDIPFRFGKAFETNIQLNDGEWTAVENGRLWSMEFESKNAYSINFIFNDFNLDDSAKLYIANADGTVIYGPVTSKQNTENGFFLTDLIEGDNVTIYLYEPYAGKMDSHFIIKRIVHAYKNIFSALTNGNLGGSGSCNNDIACYPDWTQESDAVALVLLADGAEVCSGSLLMTANQSFRPFFLSAFHCIDDPINPDGVLSSQEILNAQNWMFKFQYKKSTCNGSTATTGITYNGAQFRAAWNTSDFALMEMNTSLVADTRFSWLGWDRTGISPPLGTGIHHPSGDVMKISFDNDVIPETSQNSTNGGTSHWYVDIDNGTLERGSSGSPLFNQNKKVIGQLHSGFPGCSSNKHFWYGCFHRSWAGDLTNATRLSNWLDPCNTGIFTTNTSRSPYLLEGINVCTSGTTFTVANVPSGDTVHWTCSSNISFDYQPGNPKVFTAIGTGIGTITATINLAGCGSITLPVRTVWVGVPVITLNSFSNLQDMGYSNYYKMLPSTGTYPYSGSLSVNSSGGNNNDAWGFYANIPKKNIAYWAASGNSVDVGAKTNNAGEVLKFTAANTCATTNALYTFFTGDMGTPPPPPLVIIPNPATTQVEVSIAEAAATSYEYTSQNVSASANISYTINVINSFGVSVYSAVSSEKKIIIPTTSILNGIYIVRVTDGVKIYQGNLVVNH